MRMLKQLKLRYNYSLILLRQLVITDFKLRYQGSVLGYLWSLLRPLALFVILYIVFVKFLKVGAGVPHFPIYLLLGIVIWNFFAEVTSGSVTSIVGKGDLIRKINFPKYVIVLANSFGALINLGINLLVVAAFMAIFGTDVSAKAYLVPFLIIELFALSLGVGFFLSALFVKFRDISYIWEVILQAAFYATPILYPLSIIPVAAAKILVLNPAAQIIQDLRYLLVTQETETISTLYGGNSLIRLIPITIVIVILVFSAWYFRAQSKSFAENV